MSAVMKDLTYYLEHTDEMPTDPKEIERLTNAHMDAALEAGTEQMDVDKIVGKADVPGVAAAEEEKKDETAEEVKPAADAEPAAKPEGILAKDGKNVIPYSQLESARQRAAAAEALAKDQATELATLRAARTQPVATPDAEMLTAEELSALEAESPTLAKTLRAQQASIRSLRNELKGVVQAQRNRAASEVEEVKSEIQTAIDENPTLAAWQTAEDQTLWNEASRMDRMLRESPRYANVSFEDRFAMVVALTQQAMNEPNRELVVEEKPTLTPAQIKTAAQAKLAAVQKAKKPVTLSDIPGGAPPAVDERQKVEEMSSVALGQQFLGMTREQMDTYLQNL